MEAKCVEEVKFDPALFIRLTGMIILLLISVVAIMIDPSMMKLDWDIGSGLTEIVTLL